MPRAAHVLCLLTCHAGMQLDSRGSGLLQTPSSWWARKLFTQEEKAGKENDVDSMRRQVGKGAKKFECLGHLLVYSLLSFKELPKILKLKKKKSKIQSSLLKT